MAQVSLSGGGFDTGRPALCRSPITFKLQPGVGLHNRSGSSEGNVCPSPLQGPYSVQPVQPYSVLQQMNVDRRAFFNLKCFFVFFFCFCPGGRGAELQKGG